MLRHTVATLLLRNGVDIRWCRSFSVTRRLRRLERYTHISKEHMIGVLRKHHPSLTLGEKTALEPAG